MEEGIKWVLYVSWSNGNKERQYFETPEEAHKWYNKVSAEMWGKLHVEGKITYEGEVYYYKPLKRVKGEEISIDLNIVCDAQRSDIFVKHKGEVMLASRVFNKFDFFENRIHYYVPIKIEGGFKYEEGVVNINDYGKTWALRERDLK